MERLRWFVALELKTSRVIKQLHRRHRSREFREFLDVIEARVPAELEVHIIVDNYGTDKAATIRKWFAKRPTSMSISRPLTLPGSIWSNAGLLSSPTSAFDVVCSAAEGIESRHPGVHRRA
jgi:hypothetical protein